MRLWDRCAATIQDKLTRLWAEVYLGPVVEKTIFSSWSGESEVYWFDNPDNPTLGQATPFRTILLNKGRLEDASSDEKRYVLEHELGHQTRRPLFRGIFYGLCLWLVLGMASLIKILGYGLLIPFGYPAHQLIVPTLLCLGLITVGMGAIRLEEIFADLHVLNYITEDEYLNVVDGLSSDQDLSFIWRILKKVMYTSPRRIISIRELLERVH